jgi:hypothetical protein
MPCYFPRFSLIVVALLIPISGFGQSDTTPPTLVSFNMPSAINTTGGPQPVTVTMRLTDDFAGVFGVSAELRSPSGNQTFFVVFQRVSGTVLDGVWQGAMATPDGNFPPFTESGTWTVSTVRLSDAVSNRVVHTTATLEALGFAVSLEVTSIPDVNPPQVVGLRVTPSAIDVSAGAQDVNVQVDLTDMPAGVRGVSFLIRSPSAGQIYQRFESQLVSGTAQSGTWQPAIGAFRIPRLSESGTWTVDLSLSDTVSNNGSVSASQLRASGFSPDLTVTSVPSDTTPPQLVAFSFSPVVIDTSASARGVQVTFSVTDDLSGVPFERGDGNLYSPVRFLSPSGAQSVSGFPGTGVTRIAGTPRNGTWRGTWTFPRFSEAGTWTVDNVWLRDAVRNDNILNSASLQAGGFRTTLTVVRPSLLVDGTLTPAGGTVMDQTFGARAQVTFLPGVIMATTDVAIDVFDSLLSLPTPSGFIGPGTRFVNVELTPEPAFPLPAPGLTVVLPLINPMIPGDTLDLFRVDPATGNLVPALDGSGQPVVGTVDSGGLSATFTGVAGLSIVVGLIPVKEPFAKLTAEVQVERRGREFEMQGEFRLGANSDGIDPTGEAFRIQLGPYATAIPAGLFRTDRKKTRFEFHGVIDGVELTVRIRALGGRKFAFSVVGERANLSGITNPVTLNLVIGDDGGTAEVKAKLKKK